MQRLALRLQRLTPARSRLLSAVDSAPVLLSTHPRSTHSRHSNTVAATKRPRASCLRPHSRALATATSTTNSAANVTDDEGEIFALPRAFLVNTATIPGYEIDQVIGFVSGNTVRTRNVFLDYFAQLRAAFGGELKTYTDLMMEAREEATERMVDEAVELGANAVLNIRVETSNLAANASEIYSTAPRSSSSCPDSSAPATAALHQPRTARSEARASSTHHRTAMRTASPVSQPRNKYHSSHHHHRSAPARVHLPCAPIAATLAPPPPPLALPPFICSQSSPCPSPAR